MKNRLKKEKYIYSSGVYEYYYSNHKDQYYGCYIRFWPSGNIISEGYIFLDRSTSLYKWFHGDGKRHEIVRRKIDGVFNGVRILFK